ncbi:MAG: hypothetical protein R3F34_14565 [Planctomycetota bacterium]
MKKSKKTAKRARRSYEQRIADLQAELERQKSLAEAKKRRAAEKRELPASIKQIPKIAKTLQAFADKALEDKRQDIFNSVSLFLAGLQRIHQEELANRSEPEDIGSTDGEFDADEGGPRRCALRGGRAAAAARGAREGAASPAERAFDERLKSVARDELRRRVDGSGLSEWER